MERSENSIGNFFSIIQTESMVRKMLKYTYNAWIASKTNQ